MSRYLSINSKWCLINIKEQRRLTERLYEAAAWIQAFSGLTKDSCSCLVVFWHLNQIVFFFERQIQLATLLLWCHNVTHVYALHKNTQRERQHEEMCRVWLHEKKMSDRRGWKGERRDDERDAGSNLLFSKPVREKKKERQITNSRLGSDQSRESYWLTTVTKDRRLSHPGMQQQGDDMTCIMISLWEKRPPEIHLSDSPKQNNNLSSNSCLHEEGDVLYLWSFENHKLFKTSINFLTIN